MDNAKISDQDIIDFGFTKIRENVFAMVPNNRGYLYNLYYFPFTDTFHLHRIWPATGDIDEEDTNVGDFKAYNKEELAFILSRQNRLFEDCETIAHLEYHVLDFYNNHKGQL